ncbi:MAG: hypothetical protein K8Q89_06085 [Nitrosarchaeum sp.]|nr:hypothetical protein [Nitrosarchaeum sp.]
MAHTHYHKNTQCNLSANPPFHNNSCLNRGAEIFCTLKTSGEHNGEYMCRHQGAGPSSKQTRRKTVAKKSTTRKKVAKKSTAKRVVSKTKRKSSKK